MPDKLSPQDLFDIRGQSTFITGAAGQVGSALVQALLSCGARVAAIDVSERALEEKASTMNWDSGSVLLLTTDVRKKEQVVQAFADAQTRFGQIRHLINNAGVSVFEPFQERSEES